MIQKYILICLFLVANFANAQTADSKNYSKIKFVYEKNPSYVFEEEGIVGYSELLKKEFPLRKIQILTDRDSLKNGFIPYKEITETDKETINAFMVHQAERIVGIYDRASNSTTIVIFRNGTKSHKDLEKYFKLPSTSSSSKGVIDYKKKMFSHGNTIYNYSKKFKKVFYDLNFTSENTALFYFKNKEKTKCNAEFKVGLPQYVTPNILFSNGKNGVKQMSNIYSTTELVSVVYE